MAIAKLRPWDRDASERKMLLGRQAPFVMHRHAGYLGEPVGGWPLEWPAPFAAFLERIDNRRRYGRGPKPWRPGRYRTSRWQPYTGLGRFSGIREAMEGAYHAARYTGEQITPEDYLKRRGSPGEYERRVEAMRRATAWKLAA